MESAKWIKLDTNLFDNRKIRYLRRLPQGDAMVLLWVMLLTLAGKCNARGRIFITEEVPYTADTLAMELGVSKGLTERALDAFEALGMVERDEQGVLQLTGWEEHQNVEGMEKVREQNKQRKRRQREREKSEKGEVVTQERHVTVTPCHATEEDKEREEEIDIDKKKKSKKEKGAKAQGADALTTLSSLFSQYSFSTALRESVEDWVQYKAERQEGYTERGLKALLRQIDSNVSRYGEEAVRELMELSMASGWKGIIFDRLKEDTRPRREGEVRPEDYETGTKYPWYDSPQAEQKEEVLYPW